MESYEDVKIGDISFKIKNGFAKCITYMNGKEITPYRLSRMLTNTTDESGDGIFRNSCRDTSFMRGDTMVRVEFFDTSYSSLKGDEWQRLIERRIAAVNEKFNNARLSKHVKIFGVNYHIKKVSSTCVYISIASCEHINADKATERLTGITACDHRLVGMFGEGEYTLDVDGTLAKDIFVPLVPLDMELDEDEIGTILERRVIDIKNAVNAAENDILSR